MITDLNLVVQHPASRIVRFEVGSDGAAGLIFPDGAPPYLL